MPLATANAFHFRLKPLTIPIPDHTRPMSKPAASVPKTPYWATTGMFRMVAGAAANGAAGVPEY